MKLAVVSGGFDPVHVGHLRMIEDAYKKHGPVAILLNSDEWLKRKKGYVFMPFEQRKELLEGFRCVWGVDGVNDFDGSVCKGLANMHDLFRHQYDLVFCNGGDRKQGNVPEYKLCEELGIEMAFGIGGNDKPQSSSWLVEEAWKQKLNVSISS